MFVEKRKKGDSIKYYLVHSYRDEDNKVVKIRSFLGTNLSKHELEKNKAKAKQIIFEKIKKLRTDLFDFSLSDKEIKSINKYDVDIIHLDKKDWVQFTEDFVYNTNAIEGSTVTRNEVPQILSKKNIVNDEEIETKGVAKAINFIRTTKQDFSLKLLLKLHLLCFEGSKTYAGKFRDVEVVIRNAQGHIIHKGIPLEDLDSELKKLVDWYKKNKDKFKPLSLAAIIHNQFENIHPFQDGNGRVGRLLLNFILLKNNYPPINILLEDRAEYYKTLYEYQHNNKLRPTLRFLLKQYKKTMRKVTTKKQK